jgi:hypothetical protein
MYFNNMAFTYPLICVNVLDNEFYITMHTFLCFSLSLCPFSSGTIQGGFYTPDRESRFIMSTFRGMPCSVLEIGLRTPQFEFFSEIGIFLPSHWAYVFGMMQSDFGMWIIILRGSNSGAENRIFLVKILLWGPQFEVFQIEFAQSQWSFDHLS